MKLNTTLTIAALSLTLIGCNTTGINGSNASAMPASQEYKNVIVYSSIAEMPKHSRIIGKVQAQNKLSNGLKATPEQIIVELKRQALLKGGNGIVHVMPGTAQTTADALISN